MILLPVDEGYAYDVLSICEVKVIKKLPNSEKNFTLINESLQNQLGEIHAKILSSDEYLELIKTNTLTFDAVEKARYGSITAKEVDDLNMKRFFCKKQLQEKFFPNRTILEIKS